MIPANNINPDELKIEIVRSPRRKRTSSASIRNGVIRILVPKGLSPEREAEIAETLTKRVKAKIAHPRTTNLQLRNRAMTLNARYFQGRLKFSITWSEHQTKRWGSCSVHSKEIRISRTAEQFPDYVLDHIILHELTHLIYPNHGPEFKAFVRKYNEHDKAEGFLEGWCKALAIKPGIDEEDETSGTVP